MKISRLILGAAVAAFSFAGAANAAIAYNNPFDFSTGVGDCSFSTTCAAAAGRGDEFAAQKFTLTHALVLGGASFSELDLGKFPTDANWGFLAADGVGGLPGTILASGTNVITSSPTIGAANGFNVSQNFFDLGTVALGPGTYYFAIQAVSPVFGTYLGQGVDHTGAAESGDGGATWAFGYENGGGGTQLGGVAVELFSVPEPATWTMMLMGVGGIGFALRRRAKTVARAA